MFTAGVIYVGHKPQQTIKSRVTTVLANHSCSATHWELVAHSQHEIREKLIYLCDEVKVDLVLTIGGVNFSSPHVAPEATLQVITRIAPGISEAIRWHLLSLDSQAALLRGISGIRKQSIILNLPDNPHHLYSSLDYIFPTLRQGLRELTEAKKSG